MSAGARTGYVHTSGRHGMVFVALAAVLCSSAPLRGSDGESI